MSVVATGLAHRFGDRPWLFRDIAFTLDPGFSYAIVGPSGSGKSTLLGILAGWVEPTEGTVTADLGGRTNWVFQNPFGVARRTALDHVALVLQANGCSVAEAVDRASLLLERFGLAKVADSDFRFLSGGEAQRLMLARAFASAPGMLLVDEPTAQLDRDTSRTVNGSLRELSHSETIVVIATHDEDTRDTCDHVISLGANPEEKGQLR